MKRWELVIGGCSGLRFHTRKEATDYAKEWISCLHWYVREIKL